MINRNDLRVGNWVSDVFGNPFQVKGITTKARTFTVHYEGGKKSEKGVKPIEITPELLERFGFKFVHQGLNAWFGFDACLEYCHTKNHFGLFPFSSSMEDNQAQVIIHYVHQLQNVMYACHGQELVINL
jgi:hypothetical protein